MRYTRTLATSITGESVLVHDTANNQSLPTPIAPLGIDGESPKVIITSTGTGTTQTVTLTVNDPLSKIWKTTAAPAGATNVAGIIYKKVPKTDIATAHFTDTCGITTPVYALVSDTSPQADTQAAIGVDLSTEVLAYCIQDNAGNVARGIYPSSSVACFSASNLPTIPTLPTYMSLLTTRLNSTPPQYGYGMTTDTTTANCFRGIITSNATRLISNQFNASTEPTINWSQPAKIKSAPTQSNTNGYYYHTATTTNHLITINNTPSGTGAKVIYADGADIQINADINYLDPSTTSTTNTLLIIIAKR